MTVAARREAARLLVARGPSQRRAGALLRLYRSTFGYPARPDRNRDLAEAVQALAQRHPRSGYRRVWALRRRGGQRVHQKRVHRLGRRAQLQAPKLTRKRRATRTTRAPVQARRPGHVWTDDFVPDRGRNGTALRVLTVMDEFTREGLAIEVATALPAHRGGAVLARLFHTRGAPQFLRRDNGPECGALMLRGWLASQRTAPLYIAPGCPGQNGSGESFNGTLREECRNQHVFTTVAEARVQLEAFRRQYTEERPHSGLGYRTPAEFRRAGDRAPSGSAGP